MNPSVIYVGAAAIVLIFLAGVRVVRPTSRGLVERLGKYKRLAPLRAPTPVPAEGHAARHS